MNTLAVRLSLVFFQLCWYMYVDNFAYVCITVALSAYQWLVCYLLEESSAKLQQQLREGKDSFAARNDSQVYYCRSLSLAFIEV